MSLSLITSALFANQQLYNRMSIEAWVADEQDKGEKIALFREYVDGNHRSFLTTEMRKLLRLTSYNAGALNKSGAARTMNEFNVNYMDLVIQTMADRLEVSEIECVSENAATPPTTDAPPEVDDSGKVVKSANPDSDKLKTWIENLWDNNRFDGFQMDAHEACLRDGVTYVLVDYDTERSRVRLTHEPAYDGTSGMLVMYDKPGMVGLAIKIWYESQAQPTDTCRVNVYYPDRIEKYISHEGGALQPYVEQDKTENKAPLVLRTGGEPLGVPVIPFHNRPRDTQGKSEIEDAIPLQDGLNRTFISMVMTAELTAFQIRKSIGMQPPADITPGMWVTAYAMGEPTPEQVEWFKSIDIGVLEQGQITPFIDQAQFVKSEIGFITRTPAPEFMGGDNSSGEALKQREIGLIGKVRRFHVKAGNAWEDVVKLAHRVELAYGSENPPPIKRVYTRWRDPEIRNDEVAIKNAMLVKDIVGKRETLRLLAPIFGWDAAKIEEILAEKDAQDAAAFEQQMAMMPTFGGAANKPPNGANGNPNAKPAFMGGAK